MLINPTRNKSVLRIALVAFGFIQPPMKRYLARHILITRLAALALLTFCFVRPPVDAWVTTTDADLMPSPDPVTRSQKYEDVPATGFVFGQTLLLTVAHVSRDAGREQSPPDVRVGVWLLDSSGRVIAQSAELQILRNEFRSFDFNRAAINLPGEPGTGRLQVRARLVMNVAEPYHFTDDPRATALLVPSLELIDNSTGRTAAAFCCYNRLKQIALAAH